MLVTRVRLPACAFASYSCDSGLNPGLNIFVGRYRFQQWACDCFKIVFCEAGNTRSMHKWADSVKFFDSGFILHRKTTESSPAGNQVLQVFASMRFTNSNCNVVAFASAGATTLASFLATHVFRLADITHATTWGRVHTFFVAATLINKFYISWVPLFFVDNCEKDMDTLGFEPRAFRMRSGCDTTTPCALCSSLLDSINLLFDWPRTRKQEYSSSSCHNRLANIQCCCGIHLLHDLWLSPSSRFSFISSPLCVGRKRVEHL